MRVQEDLLKSRAVIGRLLGIGVLGLMLLAAIVVNPARAAEPPSIQLAERTLDLDAAADAPQTEIIEIEGVDNRFSALLLETLNGRFAIQTVRVTVDEGAERGVARTLAVDKVLTARDPAAEVRFSETEARVRRVEVTFRRADSNVVGKGLLRISARRLAPTKPLAKPSEGAKSPTAEPKSTPATSTTDSARSRSFVRLASQSFDLGKGEITIRASETRTVSAIQLRTKGVPVIVRKLMARFASGETRDLGVAELIEENGASRVIDVANGAGAAELREVVVSVRQRTENEKGVIELWGEPRGGTPEAGQPAAAAPEVPRTERSAKLSIPEPTPPPEPPPARRVEPRVEPPRDRPRGSEGHRREPGWKLLGAVREPDRHGRPQTRRATFAIRNEGSISALRFIPRRDAVRLFDARVIFDDGARQPLDVDRYQLEPGQMTEVLRVRSRGRLVVAVEVIFRPLGAYVGEPALELWAHVSETRVESDTPRDREGDRVRIVPAPNAPDDDDEG